MVSPLSASAFAQQVAPALQTLVAGGRLVLTASPGTGKTTRLPMLLRQALAQAGKNKHIWVLEPRRVAATLAASFVARQINAPVGESVGYHVRHDKQCGKDTRILFLTYGMFLQRLLAPDALNAVDALLFDEYHERTIEQDVALSVAMARQAKGDFGIGLLSATMDVDAMATRLAPAEICHVNGPAYPVDVTYAPRPRGQSVLPHVVRSVRRALDDYPAGDILVFLTGPKDIQDTVRALMPLVPAHVQVFALYASLDAAKQQQALAPCGPSERKVIVATNLAESSVTIDGVRIVIDAGESFRAHSDVASGIGALTLCPISQASATQRAGRAGRQGPGAAIRLYSHASYLQRPAFDLPELARLDLTAGLLRLRAFGVTAEASLWFDAMPTSHVQAAQTTLLHLGATERDNAPVLTSHGQQLARLPLHPRLAAVAISAHRAGMSRRKIAMLIAILEMPHAGDMLRATPAVTVPSDVEEALVTAMRVPTWKNAAHEHERLLSEHFSSFQSREQDDALTTALFAGFGDRVARRLDGSSRESGTRRGLALAGGNGAATLDAKSGVTQASFLLCVGGRAASRAGEQGVVVTLAHAIDAARLLDADPMWLSEAEDTIALPSGRIVRQSRVTYVGLTLWQEQSEETDPARLQRVWLQTAWPRLQTWPEFRQRLDVYQARLAYLASTHDNFRALIETVDVQKTCQDSLCDMTQPNQRIEAIDLDALWFVVEERLPSPLRQALATKAPTHVTLRHGKRLPVRYQAHAPPYIESYLQDFFEHKEAVFLGDTGARLIVHLWAPNRRPLQVTDDLASFWTKHYPTLRKQLSRRYPRHRWPA